MDPRTPPQIPPQPASAGLPPQTYTASPPKKGPRFWIIFVVIVILLMLAVGGFYTYNTINGTTTENIIQDNIAVVPTTAPIPKDNSAVVATSSATIDPSDPNLMIYDSPCMSFKYPVGFTIVSEGIIKDHTLIQGVDGFGSAEILLGKNVGNQKYTLRIDCNISASGNLKSDTDSLTDTEIFKQNGILKNMKIGNLDVNRLTFNNGVEVVIGYDRKYHLFLRGTSENIKITDPQNEMVKAIDMILNTFTPKDIFIVN